MIHLNIKNGLLRIAPLWRKYIVIVFYVNIIFYIILPIFPFWILSIEKVLFIFPLSDFLLGKYWWYWLSFHIYEFKQLLFSVYQNKICIWINQNQVENNNKTKLLDTSVITLLSTIYHRIYVLLLNISIFPSLLHKNISLMHSIHPLSKLSYRSYYHHFTEFSVMIWKFSRTSDHRVSYTCYTLTKTFYSQNHTSVLF